MREPVEEVKPGQEVASSLSWQADEALRPGARVEATDGPLGILRERRASDAPDQAYLGVDTDDGLLFVPERLIRETRLNTILLSLPKADVMAQSSPQLPPSRAV